MKNATQVQGYTDPFEAGTQAVEFSQSGVT